MLPVLPAGVHMYSIVSLKNLRFETVSSLLQAGKCVHTQSFRAGTFLGEKSRLIGRRKLHNLGRLGADTLTLI